MGEAAHVVFVVTAPSALHSPPSHEADPVALIWTLRIALRASMHCCRSLAFTYSPLQKMAPVSPWHCVVQLLASWVRHWS